ncbi:polysaccharide biosynthesis protein [Elizabethkingia miricola]|uniref:Oligosaccharide flippase family protein n=1 Tax=Elizabethkingia bruuniana TaxID=1756149 RepID=A0A7T8A073_9FLAO|nr:MULTISPECIES: oligosaccharide flippase family protein [Elizabethkingia]AQX87201.1 polysaccharide biosynthesis protein [Elizabethkingia bruuniana]KGO09382.1 polysaccharide biosynthesis protein [Elizabethkingia miricola]KUG10764.1 polysaccharide biosynthesis protein [Elizabethkingia miricola]KUY23843.1 polysaccharide biosynthesis protein [Elizabethkingia bruuniana]MCL1658149.1 oligosaccharide flippase family protein [Elizabethkingia miricola]
MYKKLLGQTAIYGFGTIIIRLFPFIISPFLTRAFGPQALAPFVDFYSVAGIIVVLLSHGMETTFFRFAEKEDDTQKLITTSTFSVAGASLLFMLLCYIFRYPIADAFKTPDQVNYLTMMLFILGIDGLSTMPFVILRKTGRPKKFAVIKILNGVINFVLLILFIVVLPKLGDKGLFGFTYNKEFGIGYVFVANLIASIATFLMLFRELKEVKFSKFSFPLWKKMMAYSWPITIAGLAGVVNETLDRQFLKYLLPEGESTQQMSIYGTVCRLVTFMTLFRQAYLMGIEPFFFSHAKKDNSGQAYSKLMTFFVVANCLMLLGLCANLEWIAHEYIRNKEYYSGIPIVPIVLVASVFLGVYLNLSIWYKLTDKTIFGAYISIIGAAVTIGINYFFIPEYGYWASAWATFASYFVMMIISFFLGQYYYPIPYNMKKLLVYLILSILFSYLSYYTFNGNLILGNGLFLIFLGLVLFLEKDTIKNFRKS